MCTRSRPLPSSSPRARIVPSMQSSRVSARRWRRAVRRSGGQSARRPPSPAALRTETPPLPQPQRSTRCVAFGRLPVFHARLPAQAKRTGPFVHSCAVQPPLAWRCLLLCDAGAAARQSVASEAGSDARTRPDSPEKGATEVPSSPQRASETPQKGGLLGTGGRRASKVRLPQGAEHAACDRSAYSVTDTSFPSALCAVVARRRNRRD